MSENIKSYQAARKLIITIPWYQNYVNAIESIMYTLTDDQILGLKREWRALWYLSQRFKKWDFAISTPDMDAKGIDIVGRTQSGEYKTFQVGGTSPGVKKINTHYYVQVTDDKVYLRKGSNGT